MSVKLRTVNFDVGKAFLFQVKRLQLAHHAAITVEQVGLLLGQIAKGGSQLEEGDMHDLTPFHQQRLLVVLVHGADIEDHLVVTALGGSLHFLHLGGGLFTNATNVEVTGLGHHLVQNGEVEVLLFRLDAGELGLHGRLLGDDTAILRHGFGELQGTDAAGFTDDVRLVPGDERAQDHLVGHPVDDVQVGEGLAGDLTHALTGHQRRDLELVGHLGGGTHHHPLEHHAHLAVVDLLEDLGHHRLEVHRGETHPVGRAEAVPQVIGHLLDADLVSGPTQIEEAVVHPAAPLDELEGGHTGVKTTGDEAQHIFLSGDGHAAQALMDGADDEELFAVDLEVDLHIRVLEAHAVAHAVLVQATTHVALYFEGGELVLAVALGAHAEGFPLELVTPHGFHLFEDVVQVGKLAGLHLEEGLNAGNAGQGFDGLFTELVIAGAHDQLVPIHPHPGIVVEAAQDIADIALQDLDETLANRLALDGDFREQLDNELHGNDSGDLDLRARIISELCGQRLLDERLLTLPYAVFAVQRQSCVYSRPCTPAPLLATDRYDEDLYLLPRHGSAG